ncbi:MAG TPA: hypothetical protein VFV87_03485, partial [Pirellulaceae bacterium]|nr:hypothetical protein [Pirellulaceae bacterium]
LQPAAESPAGRGEWLLPAMIVLLALLLGFVQMADTDIWWHLHTGQLIWERGTVPRTDWFTYTNPDSPWIDLHWGFQLGAAGLWALGGVPALVIAKSIVGALTFAICLTAQRPNWPSWHAAACWLPALLLFAGRYDVRPEMLSLLLFAVTLTILFHLRARPRLVWLLPVVQLVWVNVHALFVLGLVLWMLFLIDAALRPFLPWKSPDSESGPPAWRSWLAATGLQGAACLLNPYGWEGALFPLVLWSRLQGPQRTFYQQFAGEFLGFGDFLSQYGFGAVFQNLSTAMLATMTIATAVSFVLLARYRQFSVFRALLFVAFGYLAWQANRNGVFYGLAAGGVLRWNVGDLLAKRPATARQSFPIGKISVAAALGLLVILTALGALSPLRLLPGPRFVPVFAELGLPPFAVVPRLMGVNETPLWYAHDAARFLRQPGMPRHVFASHLGHASLCIYYLGPEKLVFADPRLEVNTHETLKRWLQINDALLSHDPAAERLLHECGGGELPALLIGTADLWPVREQFFNHPRWQPVYVDPVAVIFLPTEQAEAMNLPRVEWTSIIVGDEPGREPRD